MHKTIYNCPKCDQTFTNIKKLKTHKSHIHPRITSEQLQQLYSHNPKLCLQCQAIIPYKKKTNKFCGHSCAAIISNKNKSPRSEESRQKTRNSIAIFNKDRCLPKTKVSFCKCEICNKPFIRNSITRGSFRFCSNECKFKYQSARSSNYLKNPENRKNYGRGKKSFLEQSFETWLNSYQMSFETQVHFYNHIKKRNYFVDFYFPQFNLVIELDGTQHLKTVEQDQLRDEYLTSVYNLKVVRISHKEYVKKLKINDICNLLSIT